MLRALKLFTACLAVALLLSNCQSARADLNTYELGPFHVDGFGATADEAMADAYGNLYDMLVEIENNLPEGHFILDFVIEDQGWASPFNYYIDFHVIIGFPNGEGVGL